MKHLLQAMFSPTIVMKGYEFSLPEGVKKDVEMSRLLNPSRQTATNEEAMAYLSTMSLAVPLDKTFADIYLILSNEYVRKKTGQLPMPEYARDMTADELIELRRLKDWIFKEQQKHLVQRGG